MLNTQLNISNADQLYSELIALHDGLSPQASAELNARLILLMMNHIGDEATIGDIFQQAKLPSHD